MSTSLHVLKFGGDYLEKSKAKRLTFVPRVSQGARVQRWYQPVLPHVIGRGAATLVQHSVWRVGSGRGYMWAHVRPHRWPHAGPWAGTLPPVRMIIPSLQDGNEKTGLNLNIKDLKIVASGPISSWQIGKKWKQWQIFLGSKITGDNDFKPWN